MSSKVWFPKVSQLPLRIESYELSGHDREYSAEFIRPSTVIHLRGDGHEGIGEDVVYDVLDHVHHRDVGAVHDFTGVRTLGEFCTLAGELDLFPGAPPEMEASLNYRRWAFESAALDLALRQNGIALHTALGLDPKPLSFVASTRLSGNAGSGNASDLDPVRLRMEKHPGLTFKLDPENDWTPELIVGIAELTTVRILDLKGHYKGTVVDVETNPELYKAVAEAFPDAWLEDADVSDLTRDVLEPHLDRLSWDAPLHSLADITSLERKPLAINSKPSRFGSLEELFAIYEHCEREGITVYAGGQGEFTPGRGQAQYMASLFHPDSPNDIAPSVYNDPSVPDGMPDSPLQPAPSDVGFRWEA